MYDLYDAKLYAYKLTQDSDGYDQPEVKETEVFVNVKSVNYKEFYQATAVGIKPTLIAVMDFFDYESAELDGIEPSRIEIDGKFYKIVRAYNTEVFDYIELTLERDLRNGDTND